MVGAVAWLVGDLMAQLAGAGWTGEPWQGQKWIFILPIRDLRES